jgi:hypothetical protein
MNDAQAMVLDQTVVPGFYTGRAACACNGFSWCAADSGNLVASFPSTSYFQYQ